MLGHWPRKAGGKDSGCPYTIVRIHLTSGIRVNQIVFCCLIGFCALCPPDRVKAQPGPLRMRPKTDRYGDPLPPGAVLRLGTVKFRQDSPIFRIAYTPDGRYLITDGKDSILRVWKTADGKTIRYIDPNVGALEDFDVSADGTKILGSGITEVTDHGMTRNVCLVDFATGRVFKRASWVGTESGPLSVALCLVRGFHAIGSEDGFVLVRDAWTGKEVFRFDTKNMKVDHIFFDKVGQRLAVLLGSPDSKDRSFQIQIHDLARGLPPRTIDLGKKPIMDLAFSPDGSRIAVSASSGLVVFATGIGEKQSDQFDCAFVDRIAFSGDGRRIAAVGPGFANIFDALTNRLLAAIPTEGDSNVGVAVSPDGNALVTSDGEGVLRCWDVKRRIDRFAMPDAEGCHPRKLLVSKDGKAAITAGEDNSIRLWDLLNGRQTRVISRYLYAMQLALSSDGRQLAALDDEGELFLWNLQRPGTRPVVMKGNRDGFASLPLALDLAFVDGDQRVLSFSNEGRLFAWDVRSGHALAIDQPRFHFDERQKQLDLVAPFESARFLSGDERLAASFNKFVGGGLRVIDLGTMMERTRLNGGERLACSPDGRLVAVATDGPCDTISRHLQFSSAFPKSVLDHVATSGTITVQNVDTGKVVLSVDVQGSPVWVLAFSPDSKTLAATSGWGTGEIHFFEVLSGRETRTISCSPLRSPALAFTPDGSRLLSGMADGSVLVWDVRTEKDVPSKVKSRRP